MAAILFFGKLKDDIGLSQLAWPVKKPSHVEALLKELITEYPQWQGVLCSQRIMIAVDQVMGSLETTVVDDSEVAFFPPVTGG